MTINFIPFWYNEEAEVNVTWNSKKMNKIFSDERKLIVKFGATIAKKVQLRIWEMQQVDDLRQLSLYPPAGLHELKGQYAGLFAVALTGNWRLIVQGFDEQGTSTTQLETIVNVVIVEVIDYH
jgi:proteic killer suppression protein